MRTRLYSFFLSMKTINYQTVVNYFEKRGCRVIPGIDTLVYDLAFNETQKITFKKDYSSYSTNSQDNYFTLPEYPSLDFKLDVQHTKYWLWINVSFSGFDVPTVNAMQFFVNDDTQKLTLYGLFFRFCELAEMDRKKFMKDIAEYVGYPPTDNPIRWDHKIDIIGVNVKDFLKKLMHNNEWILSRESVRFTKKWQLETIYLWNKQSKYAFPRLYDKNKDTLKKWKEVFYKDYIGHEVTRLEIQTGSNFIWELNTNERLEKISSYIGNKTTFKGNYFVGKRYNPNFILNTDFFSQRLENALLKATKNWINLQKTFDSVNKKQSYFLFTYSSLKWKVQLNNYSSSSKQLLISKTNLSHLDLTL